MSKPRKKDSLIKVNEDIEKPSTKGKIISKTNRHDIGKNISIISNECSQDEKVIKKTNKPDIEKYSLDGYELSKEDSKYIDKVIDNTKSNLIKITDTKLELILVTFLPKLGSRTRWITPLSLFITIFLTELTATFIDKFGIKAALWDGLFFCFCIISFAWFCYDLSALYSNWNKSTLRKLMAIIKKEQEG